MPQCSAGYTPADLYAFQTGLAPGSVQQRYARVRACCEVFKRLLALEVIVLAFGDP